MCKKQTIHLCLKLKGGITKREFFNWLVTSMDPDWPWTEKREIECKICGGGVWINPRFSIEELKTIARQVNEMNDLPGHFSIKIKRWGQEKSCLNKKGLG